MADLATKYLQKLDRSADDQGEAEAQKRDRCATSSFAGKRVRLYRCWHADRQRMSFEDLRSVRYCQRLETTVDCQTLIECDVAIVAHSTLQMLIHSNTPGRHLFSNLKDTS